MRTIGLIIAVLACEGSAHAAARAEQTVGAARLVDAARAALPVASAGLTITAQVVGAPQDAVVPEGTLSLHADRPKGHWPRSRVAVPVEIWVNGRPVRSETVWFDVQALGEGFVYGEGAAVGMPAAKLASHRAPIDLATLNEAPISAMRDIADERLKRGVHAGWPVLKSDFEPIPDIDRNARVVVHVLYGAVRIQTVATALQAGDVGDAVSVLVEGTRLPVEARVEAKGIVDIAR